jgi:hypothetical protein
VGETVYVDAGQGRVCGPFVVVSIASGNQYKLKRKDNNVEHPNLVPEDKLLVQTSN